MLLVVCVVSTAFFSACETALTALGEAKTRQIVDESNGKHLLKLWQEFPERVLTSLLIGNTTVSVGGSALATGIAEDLGIPHGVAISAGAMTLGVLLFGEVIPKTFAKQHAMAVSRFVIPFVYLLCVLLYPFASVLTFVSHKVIGRFFVGTANAPSTSEEEIEYLINLGTREGVLDEVKEELLNSVLEFADRLVKEIMVPRTKVVAVNADMDLDVALKFIGDSEHSRLPVYKDSVDNIIGIVNIKDILKDVRHGIKSDQFKLEKYIRPPFFVPELMKISRLLREFQQRKLHMAVVVDEFGGTSGIVTLEDVVEEIVGEIQDEHDAEEKQVKTIGPNRYLADAGIPVRDLEELLGVSFPEEGDYETLGGFLAATAGKVPPPGSLVAWSDISFIVRAGDERRVLRVEIHGKPVEGQPSGPHTSGPILTPGSTPAISPAAIAEAKSHEAAKK
jgi:CBS domain containing-hemolysin-like protein